MSVESRHRETRLQTGPSQETVALPNNSIKLLYVIRYSLGNGLEYTFSNFVSNFINMIAIIVFLYSADQISLTTKTTEKDRAIRRKHEWTSFARLESNAFPPILRVHVLPTYTVENKIADFTKRNHDVS